MATWVIKDKDGNVTNPGMICNDEQWLAENFDYYEKFELPKTPPLSVEEEARQWRDAELSNTDHVAGISDFPNRNNVLAYRVSLRDWPSTADFPNTKPELSS